MNKKYSTNFDDAEDNYIPEFNPVDEDDFTFMGRLLTKVLSELKKSFYLDQTNTWYDFQGNQVWGIRFVNFLHENLGTQFL